MHRPSMRHSAIFGSVVAATALGLTGFAGTSFSAAIVGETRYLTVEQKAVAGLDAMKAQYRRPASIPFPKNNPYTPEKLALGKKLYFDTRISVSSAQSCASWLVCRRRLRHGATGPAFADHRQCGLGSDLHVGRPARRPRGAGARSDPIAGRDEHAGRTADAAARHDSGIQAAVRGRFSLRGDESQDTREGDRDLRADGRLTARALR